MVEWQNNVVLSGYTTLRVGGPAKYFADIRSVDQLFEVADYATNQNIPLAVIGEGSNTLFTDDGFEGIVIRMVGEKYSFEQRDSETVVTAEAGVNWDRLVDLSVARGLTGIEALSHIPGSTGAAPVQNIGAYGQELSETLFDVEAYDLEENELVNLTNEACKFGYRDSIFKSKPGRYIITSVRLKLKEGEIEGELYKSLSEYLNEHSVNDRSPQTIRDALYQIRWSKLPKPNEIPNAGSFFKNPIVSRDDFDKLTQEHPDIPNYPANDQVKIPAGWLVEQTGFKGQCVGPICSYDKQALVLINPDGDGTFKDIQAFKAEIIEAVKGRFGVTLEQEPIVITT